MYIRCVSVILCLLHFGVYGQVNEAFIEHLTANKLHVELKSYLDQHPLPEDSASYYQTKWNFDFGTSGELLTHAYCAREVLLSDPKSLVRYSISYLDPRSEMSQAWFEGFLDSSMLKNDALRAIHFTYYLSKYPSAQATVPTPLESDYRELLRANRKKPVIAAGLSAIVPGMGLLYINKPRSALSSFVFVGALGVQTAESVNHFGWKHPLTVVNGSFLLGYYLVNVIGSAIEVKKNKLEKRNQFLIHASRYYTDSPAFRVR